MEPKYKIDPTKARLHLSKGNSKIGDGIWSFSTLPGNAEHLLAASTAGLLTDIPGTCSKHCETCFNSGCYAVSSALRYHTSVIPAWADNTILLRNGKLWEQLEIFITLKNSKAEKYLKEAHEQGIDPDRALARARELAVIKVFRVNVSGEIENVQELRQWNLLALAHPYIQLGVYSKNFEALAEFLDGGNDFADNFVVNISQWNHCADEFLQKYAWANLNSFVYDDHTDPEVAKLAHCPAVDAKGHHAKRPDGTPIQCSQCLRCYRKTGQMTAVHAH